MKIDNSQGSVLTFIFKQAAGETAWYRFGALIYEKVAAWKRHPIKQLCWQEHYKVELWVKQTITDCNYVHYCLSQLPVPFFGGEFAFIPSSAFKWTHLSHRVGKSCWFLVAAPPKEPFFCLYGMKEVIDIIPVCIVMPGGGGKVKNAVSLTIPITAAFSPKLCLFCEGYFTLLHFSPLKTNPKIPAWWQRSPGLRSIFLLSAWHHPL